MTTNLIRWRPLDGTLNLRTPLGEVDRLFDDFFRTPALDWPQASYPPADVSEAGDAYTVTVEIPGLKKEDITLSVQDNILSVRFNKQAVKEEESRNYRHVERFYGTFERHFPFSTAIDAEKIKASYRDGVLEIAIPKTENARRREIQVEVK